AARDESSNFENLQNLIESKVAPGVPPVTIKQVVSDREVRKESQILRDIADAPLGRRKKDASFGVRQDMRSQLHESGAWAPQTGNHIEQGSLAGTRGTENDGDSVAHLK